MSTNSTTKIEQFMLASSQWSRKIPLAHRMKALQRQGVSVAAHDNALFSTDEPAQPTDGAAKSKDNGDRPPVKKGKKQYVFDASGHIVIATTQGDPITPAAQETFKKAAVFLAAWTAAAARAHTTLFDYDVVSSVIRQSEYFATLGVEECKIYDSGTSISLGGDIVMSILDGLKEGDDAMDTAKKIVASFGGRIRASQSSSAETQTKAHLLLICESILSVPVVHVVFSFVKEDMKDEVTTTDCSKSMSGKAEFTFHKEVFMFVDPDYINEYSSSFGINKDFEDLVDRIAKPKSAPIVADPGSAPPAAK